MATLRSLARLVSIEVYLADRWISEIQEPHIDENMSKLRNKLVFLPRYNESVVKGRNLCGGHIGGVSIEVVYVRASRLLRRTKVRSSG